MIRIAICDDEKHMSDHIRSFVSEFFRKKNQKISLRMFSSGGNWGRISSGDVADYCERIENLEYMKNI